MRSNSLLILLPQALMLCCAIAMSFWVDMPGFALVALTVAGITILDASVAAKRGDARRGVWPLLILWSCTFLVPAGLFFSGRESEHKHLLFVGSAMLIAASLFGTGRLCGEAGRKRSWRGLGIAWMLLGSLTWLGIGYSRNHAVGFYSGLALSAALLIAAKRLFHLSALPVLFINTLLALAILLPASELVFHSRGRLEASPEVARRLYSYNTARTDPGAFARWWAFYGEQWQLLLKDLCVPDASRPHAYRLRPGARHTMFQSPISINSKGFRGKEIAEDKGNVYRIVVLGESTTFGVTLRSEDRPWPEVLAQLINDRLKPTRQFEVINAGVPGWTLQDNLQRLSADILPLKPDLIISYHGFNGFRWWYSSIPFLNAPPPPRYQDRPIRLLAAAEHGLRTLLYKKHMGPKAAPSLSPTPDPMQGTYAEAYRHLIEAALTNRVRLALGTFSMAVNSQSDPDVVEFYRPAFGFVRYQMAANALHSTLVRKLTEEHPEVGFVDTQPHLDGDHEKFIDLIHLTQPGRQQLAENFFEGIRKILEQDLLKQSDLRAVGAATPTNDAAH